MTTSRILEFFISAPAHGRKPSHTGKLGRICAVLMLCVGMAAAVNPVPFVNQPLLPDAAAPGGPGFTLTVNGTGFVPSSVVFWNGSPRTTQFVSQGQLTATIPATDIAKAGTASVTVVSPGPGGGASATFFFPIAEPSSSVFFTESDFSSPGGNIHLVTADFNGDGKLDIAASTYYDSTVRIFLGNGDGTFTAGPTYSVCNAHGLATGDFNGDGITDLAVGNSECGQITILLGNRDGTFKVGGNFETGGNGGEVEVGDFNGDGKLDLVSEGYTAAVLLGNGDGTFQAPVNYSTVAGGLVVVGDFNGDGQLDFAVDSGSDSAVSIMLGNGDGTFQPQSQYQVTGTNHGGVVLADLNQDGKLDLAVSDNEGWVSVLLGNGDGTFRTGGNYDTGGLTAELTGADFNGHGVLDLVAANYYSSSLSLLLGNGDGTFQAPVLYPAGYGARGMAVGDFNGDGRLDVAVGNQFADTISIFLNLPPGPAVTFTPSSLTFGPQPVGTFSPDQLVTVTNTGSESVSFSGINPAGGDFYRINNCPRTLLPNASCTLDVIFTPTATGTRSGQVLVRDNVPDSPQKLPLTGTGTGTGKIRLSISPAALDFGSVGVGATSPPQSVTVTNIGTATADFSTPLGPITEGVNCDEFQITSQCGTALAPNSSCQVAVTFAPMASGTRTSSLLVLQGAHTVSAMLNGIGTP